MPSEAAITARMPSRSLGLKLLLVCALALLMAIPSLFVFFVISERSNRAQQVEREIGQLVGGPQNFVGPILLVPYSLPGTKGAPAAVAPERAPAETVVSQASGDGVYVIFPKTAYAQAAAKTEVRRKGMFSAPVWNADVVLMSDFDLAGAGAKAPRGAVLHWPRAELVVGASDARGARSDIQLKVGDKTVTLAPAATIASVGLATPDIQNFGENGRPSAPGPDSLRLFGTPAEGLIQAEGKFRATASAKFAGASQIGVLAWGETTEFCVVGDWQDPDFARSAFPTTSQERCHESDATEVDPRPAFTGYWTVPNVARGIAGEGTLDVLQAIGSTAMQVRFFQTDNPYTPVERSLKYAPMFLGLVFLSYFMFETRQRRRVHPAQYVLIGLAQIIFYMLLLSLAEQIGFDLAFALSGGATVALISAYAGWVFESRKQGLIALAVFAPLYGLIYVLMRIEDYALLVGAVASFAAIAAVMYFTRNIDWYGSSGQAPAPAPKP